ncbi:MAG: hypothetical protein RL172_2034, partial [Bacteroidota bacterium]
CAANFLSNAINYLATDVCDKKSIDAYKIKCTATLH